MRASEPFDAACSSHRFCDYVAHELANPLNGMLASAETIERCLEAHPKAIDEVGELLGFLRGEIKRLALLLKELRSSRASADINLRPTSLPAELGELIALQSTFYEQHGIRIEDHVPLDLPRIMADKNKLRQVLLNLCKNAVEAMPQGGTLTLQSYASPPWLCLDIADTGDGLVETMPVFKPAVTSKPNGSGLGLAIVREIVQQHNGMVSYESELGKGTTFHLRFPIYGGGPPH